MNDLIVNADNSPAAPNELAGARAFASAQALANSETDLEKGLNGMVMGLDILAMALNPLKELLMAGVGFLIEHVGPLKDFLEYLAGDPASITATRDTWLNIEAALHQAADDLVAESGSLSDWSGDAADAYRLAVADFEGAIKAGGSGAGSLAKYMNAMGVWTAVTRGLVLELICDFVSRVIMYALSALASSWFTFGGSIATMISVVIADAMVLIAKLGQKIAKLGQAMQGLMPRFSTLSGVLDDAGKAVSRFGTKMDINFQRKEIDFITKSLDQQDVTRTLRPPGPLGGSSVPKTQGDLQHSIYDTLSDPFGSGNIPHGGKAADTFNTEVTKPLTWGDTTLVDGKSVPDIIGGYPMTGFKGGAAAIPDAAQAEAGDAEEADSEEER